jgi:hypothetical protein
MAQVPRQLERLSHLLRSQEKPSQDELTRVLYLFFLDAVPHLVAAGQLYDFIPVTFAEQHGVHFLEEIVPGNGDGAENKTAPVVGREQGGPGNAIGLG